MKKHGILNSEISSVLSKLGHTDLIMIADCGLPIPDAIKRIDLAIKPGEPKFIDVLEVVLRDLTVEKYFYASEIKAENIDTYKQLEKLLAAGNSEAVLHDDLKEMSKDVKAIIRTGEITPYANIILQAGVNFEELYENYSKEH